MIIIIIFVLNSVYSTAATSNFTINKNNSNVLYVGGNGTGNYSTIQIAINHATAGDTIFVYDDSSPYIEHLHIDKQLILVGENRNTTIIDGNHTNDVIIITADQVIITEFTIRNSGETPMIDAGIECQSDNNVFINNIIRDNKGYAVGIFLNNTNANTIRNNKICFNGNEGIYIVNGSSNIIQFNEIHDHGHCAIVISKSTKNQVLENIMYNNHATISIWPNSTRNEIAHNMMINHEWSGMGIWQNANNNYVHHNQLKNNGLHGITIREAKGNRIAFNEINTSQTGILLEECSRTLVTQNNLLNNNQSAWFENSTLTWWKNNYWDDHTNTLPKVINGQKHVLWNKTLIIPWINIDLRPAQSPHLIS